MKSAILLSTQRSGTNFFRSVLGQHERINPLFGEIFDPGHNNKEDAFFPFWVRLVHEQPQLCLPENRIAVFARYVEYIEKKSANKIPLMDVKYGSTFHLNDYWLEAVPPFYKFISEYNLPVIHLVRKNLLDTEVSGIVANKTGKFWVPSTAEAEQPRIALDARRLVAILESRNSQIEQSRNLIASCRTFEVTYEDLFMVSDDRQSFPLNEDIFSEVVSFLGLEPAFKFEAGTKKLVTKSKPEIIENYDEVCAALAGTPYAWMVE